MKVKQLIAILNSPDINPEGDIYIKSPYSGDYTPQRLFLKEAEVVAGTRIDNKGVTKKGDLLIDIDPYFNA